MALIKDGYWQDTYWASRYWQEDYWLEYGTYVPPLPPAPTGTRAGGAVTWERPLIEPLRREEQQVEEIVPQPLTLPQMLALLSHLEPRVATVEDLKRVLAPFLEAKQIPDEAVEERLRELILSFKHPNGVSVEEGLRKIIQDCIENKEHN